MYPQYPIFNPVPMQMPQFSQQMQMQPQLPQTQLSPDNNIVRVQSIEEAKAYPVAPGHSITFKDDNAPFVYTKTMDSSQMGQPIFEKFRLVKEEEVQTVPQEPKVAQLNIETELQAIKEDIGRIKDKLYGNDRRRPDRKGGDEK